MDKCVFCKIVEKSVKSRIVAENEDALCFLDANPLAKGHCLVVPKTHHVDIFEIDSKILKSVIELAKTAANKVKRKLGATGINILHASGKDAQQSVFHFHLHIVPRFENDGLNTWPESDYKEDPSDEEINSLLTLK